MQSRPLLTSFLSMNNQDDTLDATIINNEFNRIKQNGTGGFDQRQVQLILTHLHEQYSDIYIPTISAIDGSDVLPLNSLHDHGYKFAAFSLQLNEDHQVGVWIELDEHTHRVKVYDSLSANSLTNTVKTNLARLLNVKENQIEQVASPYRIQTDGWSCGVHAIKILSDNYQRTHGASIEIERNAASAASPIPALATYSSKPVLEVDKLGLEYYQYYIHQAKINEKIEYKKHLNELRIQDLLNNIEAERFKQGFYPNTHTVPGDVLKPLADYLQMIMWGNLDRTTSPSENKNRARQSQSFMIQQTLETLYQHFSIQSNENQRLLNRLFELYIILIGDDTNLNAPYFIDSLFNLHNKYLKECSQPAPSQKERGRGYDMSILTMDLPTAKLIIEQEITQFTQALDKPKIGIRGLLFNVLTAVTDKPLLSCLSTAMKSDDLTQDEYQQAVEQYYTRMPITHQYTLVWDALNYINHIYHNVENDKRVNNARIHAEQQAYLDAHQAEENEKNDFIAHMKGIGVDIPQSQTNNIASIKKMLRQASAIKTYINPIYVENMTISTINQLLEKIFNTKEDLDFLQFLYIRPDLNIKEYYDWFFNHISYINPSDEKFIANIISEIKDTNTYIKLLEHISEKSTSTKLKKNADTLLSVTELITNPISYQALLSPTYIVNFMLHPIILQQLSRNNIYFSILANQTEEKIALLLSENIMPLLNDKMVIDTLFSLPSEVLKCINSPFAKTIIEENLLPLFSFTRNPTNIEKFLNDKTIEFLRMKIFSMDILRCILDYHQPLDITLSDLIDYSLKMTNNLSMIFSAIDKINLLTVDEQHTTESSMRYVESDKKFIYIKVILNNLKFLSDYLPPCYFEISDPIAVLQFTKKLNDLKNQHPNKVIGFADAVELLSDDVHYTDKFVASFDVNNHDLLAETLAFINHEQFITLVKRIIELSSNAIFVQNATIILEYRDTDLLTTLTSSDRYWRQELLLQPHKKHAIKFMLLPNRRLFKQSGNIMNTLNNSHRETLTLLSNPELNIIINRECDFITNAVEMSIPMLTLYISLLLNKINRSQLLPSDFNTINQATRDGKTLLYYAVKSNNLKLSRMLLECGATPTILIGDDSIPLIWIAVYDNHSAMIELLLDHGANVNTMYKKQTPLMHVVKSNNHSLCHLLLLKHADINSTDGNNHAPLYRAVKNDNVVIAKLLLEAGAQIPAQQPPDDSLLEIALYHRNSLLLKLLVIHGCDITKVAQRARRRGSSMWQAHFEKERLANDLAKSFDDHQPSSENCKLM